MIIKSLDGVPFEAIHAASAAAFADYVEPLNLSISQLRHLLERRGFNQALSFAAFVDGEIAGFTMNGFGDWEDVPTAYDCGTAVRKEYRSLGIATRLFESFLPELQRLGIQRYLLEVIKTNTRAVRLYEKLGFAVSREFDYWVASPDAVKTERAVALSGLTIDEIDAPDWVALRRLWDYSPSWQNSIDSVMRKREHFSFAGVRHEGAVVAYACMENNTGDLAQLAVHPAYRRRGLATSLVGHLLDDLKPPEFRVTNTLSGNQPTWAFLHSLGLEPGHGQLEMVLEL